MKLHKLHPWHLSPKEAIEIQSDLAKKLFFPPLSIKDIALIAGATVVRSKTSHLLYGSVVIMDFNKKKVIEIQSGEGLSEFPDLPGLHGFRELPLICHLFEKLEHQPDVILYEGEGIAHQRGCGVASQLGLWLDTPVIGCTQSKVVGDFEEPSRKGTWSPLHFQNAVVGAVLKTKAKSDPFFISPGFKIDLDSSLEVIQHSLGNSAIPEPLLQAQERAKAH